MANSDNNEENKSDDGGGGGGGSVTVRTYQLMKSPMK